MIQTEKDGMWANGISRIKYSVQLSSLCLAKKEEVIPGFRWRINGRVFYENRIDKFILSLNYLSSKS